MEDARREAWGVGLGVPVQAATRRSSHSGTLYHRSRQGPMRTLCLMAAAMLLAACSDSTSPPDGSHLSVVGSEVQSASPLDTLPRTVSVKVVDDKGDPQMGVEVNWSTSAPYSAAVPASSLTDQFGVAQTKWVLGLGAGTQHLQASVPTYQETVDITANATAGLRAGKLMSGEPQFHMCALNAEQQAWCWGQNNAGQLGSSSVAVGSSSDIPVAVTGGHRFTTLIGGYDTSCGIDADHHLWCWGSNRYGIFGDGTTTDQAGPVLAAGGLELAHMDLGAFGRVACGVTLDGTGYCWGDGVMGDGNGETQALAPVAVMGGARWQTVGTGDDYSCGVQLDSSVWCWGIHPSAAGFTYDPVLTPTLVPGVPPLATLSAGWWNPCGMRADQTATVVCWGSSLFWQASGTETPLYTFNEPAHAVRSTSSTYLFLTSTGLVKYLGNSPYWYDGFVNEPHEVTSDGPWSDVTSSESQIFGIYQPDGVVYELRLTIRDADESGWVIETHPKVVQAP